ncbi:unnamed protein product [Vicia faba]|uniref:Transmembrane protein n=1 Tax=Vicia faba TaxID=3906 RepID=A0AAV1BDA9_VICFA|nr:unnamed protein product [Vicia faba]
MMITTSSSFEEPVTRRYSHQECEVEEFQTTGGLREVKEFQKTWFGTLLFGGCHKRILHGHVKNYQPLLKLLWTLLRENFFVHLLGTSKRPVMAPMFCRGLIWFLLVLILEFAVLILMVLFGV